MYLIRLVKKLVLHVIYLLIFRLIYLFYNISHSRFDLYYAGKLKLW